MPLTEAANDVLALAIALASYPLVRRLTGRLERLQASVERMGGGDPAARARVEGHDEIAGLADGFNGAAGRIEALVDAHRALLANASHELRTPLSRIRLGVAMFRGTGEEDRLANVETDIRQLDRLIDEILTLGRLDAAPAPMEPGIDPADRDRVFERFYRGAGRQDVDGYGLGLPLVRQIAGAHGGRVEIAAGPDSAVVVTLPRSGGRHERS